MAEKDLKNRRRRKEDKTDLKHLIDMGPRQLRQTIIEISQVFGLEVAVGRQEQLGIHHQQSQLCRHLEMDMDMGGEKERNRRMD